MKQGLTCHGGRAKNKLGFINAFLICEQPQIENPIRLYIDTGASHTTIADRDAIRFGIDYEQLEKSEGPVVGIGTRSVQSYILKDVTLAFKKVGGGYNFEQLNEVFVLKNDYETREELKRIARIPSLLGIDVLERYHIHFTKKRVIIERK